MALSERRGRISGCESAAKGRLDRLIGGDPAFFGLSAVLTEAHRTGETTTSVYEYKICFELKSLKSYVIGSRVDDHLSCSVLDFTPVQYGSCLWLSRRHIDFVLADLVFFCNCGLERHWYKRWKL